MKNTQQEMQRLADAYPFLAPKAIERLFRCYGTECAAILGQAQTAADLGAYFGSDLYEAELSWLAEREFAHTAEDVLWRRTKLGLRLSESEKAKVAQWFAERSSSA